MDSLEDINKKLNSSYRVQKIVKTMKALSITNIKLYEKSVDALYQYKSNIELGMQAILSKNPNIISEFANGRNHSKETKDIMILYGSNQGLCGKFNDKVFDFFTGDDEGKNLSSANDKFLIVVGNRLRLLFEHNNIIPNVFLSMPSSVEETIDIIHSLLNSIDGFKDEFNIGKIIIYYLDYKNSASILIKQQLLPIDKDFFKDIGEKVWPTNVVPFWRIDTKDILLDFVRQFVFINLYYSLVNSIISEQKYRLMSLQSSEKNISDLIRETKLGYNQRKQNLITSEMLDIISGYNALKHD